MGSFFNEGYSNQAQAQNSLKFEKIRENGLKNTQPLILDNYCVFINNIIHFSNIASSCWFSFSYYSHNSRTLAYIQSKVKRQCLKRSSGLPALARWKVSSPNFLRLNLLTFFSEEGNTRGISGTFKKIQKFYFKV